MSATDDADTAPWRDPATLRRLYVEQDLERHAVAARLGCRKSTIDDYLAEYGIKKTGNLPHQDRDTLQRLYHDEGLSMAEIADHFGTVEATTIQHWMDKLGIETGNTTYSEGELARHLRRVDTACEYRVTQDDLRERDGPSPTTYTSRFGSWDAALKAVGIDPDAPTRPPVYRETLDNEQGTILLSRTDAARELARLEEPFLRSETTFSESDFGKFRTSGIIRHADDRRVSNPNTDSDSTCWAWETADGVVAWIEQHLDLAGECPAADCDSSGVSNLGDGVFTCSSEDCDARFDRKTAEGVLGR